MSRIDANIATQLGDGHRPQQSAQDTRLQAQAGAAASADSSDGAPVTADDLRAVAQQMKRVIESSSGRKIGFDIDSRDHSLYLKIIDESTGEVLRELPSKEARDLRDRLDEMLGVLLDKKA